MTSQTTAVGFFEPTEPRDSATARYLRTLGGAVMRADYHPERELAMWVCAGCQGEGRYGWPLDRPAPNRHATEQDAWSAAQEQALAHAHACRAASRFQEAQPAPATASRVDGEPAGRWVTLDVDPRLALVHQPLVELVQTTCENLADLVAEHTGASMANIRIGVTTWWGMFHRRLTEALAVTGQSRSPRPRVYAAYLYDAVRDSITRLATTFPDSFGGVTILINTTAIAHCAVDVRRLLLHELRHAAQLADPAHRAMFIDQIRHDTRVQRRDTQWLDRVDAALELDEALACEAEDWTWAALNEQRAAEDAAWRAEADQRAETDRAQAALGNVRTACRWCNDEFYVSRGEPGPHSCRSCRYKDGF